MDTKKTMDAAEAENKKSRLIAKEELAAVALALLAGFCTGRATLAFGAVPFGFGLLCALRRQTVPVYLGLCLSLLGRVQTLPLLAAYTLCLAVRAFISVGASGVKLGELSQKIFCEHLSVRAVIAAFGAFGVGLYRLAKGGFAYYHLFGTLIAIFGATVAALLWSRLSVSFGKTNGFWNAVSQISLFAVCVWGLREVSVYGVWMGTLACILVTLTATRRSGLILGCFTALVCGLCVSFDYAPLFVFGAVCYGFLSSVSSFAGCFASFSAGMLWGFYVGGVPALAELLPALVTGNFIFFIVDKLYLEQAPELADAPAVLQLPAREQYLAAARLFHASDRMSVLHKGLDELSKTLSSKKAIFSTSCDISALLSSASVGREGLCAEIGEMCVDEPQSTKIRTLTPTVDLLAVSEFFAEGISAKEENYEPLPALTEKIITVLQKQVGEGMFGACAYKNGKTHVIISCNKPQLLEEHKRELCQAVGEVCRMRVRCGQTRELDGIYYMSLESAPVLAATFAGKKRSSPDEPRFCGDSFGTVEIANGARMAAFISDGMGSGEAAAEVSGLCSLFMQALLPTEFAVSGSAKTTLAILDSFLCARNAQALNECSSTVDLALFDLEQCRATFYKSGAAPTYVFRDGTLFKLRSNTPPMGIIPNSDIGKITMEILPGDTVVMISDGISEGKDDCPELFSYIHSRLLTHTPAQLADAMIKYADSHSCPDDVSTLVVRFSLVD